MAFASVLTLSRCLLATSFVLLLDVEMSHGDCCSIIVLVDIIRNVEVWHVFNFVRYFFGWDFELPIWEDVFIDGEKFYFSL